MTWYPHDGPQLDFCETWQDEVLYGGQAGGGKTDCLIAEAARFINYPDYKAIILRRTYKQLEEILDRMRLRYPAMGGEYRAGEHRWYFPSGSKINIGHCSDDGSEYIYQGGEWQFIGFDEAGQFLPKQLLYLFSRCRSTNPAIPKRIRYATNPGGPAHTFLKDRFRIGEYPKGNVTFAEEVDLSTLGIDRVEVIYRTFIPASIQDNPSLVENDPGYIVRLMQLPEIERMRLLYGVWDAFEGQVFTELNREVHSCKPFEIPPEWKRYRTFDWGYSAPFSVLWWAVDFDGTPYLYREWYGAKKDDTKHSWVGIKMTSADIARGIFEREEEDKKLGARVMPGPADPSIWSKRRDSKTGIIGPSVADEMLSEGITWLRADNDRILGKQQFHSRLALNDEGHPHVYIFDNCEHWWRTIPLLREDPKRVEDVDTDQEDHIFDACKYFFMFRPLKPRARAREEIGTFQTERRKYINAKKYAIQHGVSLGQAYGMVR